VLRTADYRDNDKMLTLFSREIGRIDALSRGCKKTKSSLLACSQPFICGMYSYYIRQGKYYISQCEITDTFYALREDVERFSVAAYIAEVTEKTINHEEQNEKLFSLVANCFFTLKRENSALSTLVFYLVKYTDISGYRPNIYSCIKCGKKTAKSGNYFSGKEGGVICSECAKDIQSAKKISGDALKTIHGILSSQSKDIKEIAEYEYLYEIKEIYMKNIEDIIERKLYSAAFLDRIFINKL
jgi:DNA repair protein RecO (recombination protein O)